MTTAKSLKGMLGLCEEFAMTPLLIKRLASGTKYVVVTYRNEHVSRPYELAIWDCEKNRTIASFTTEKLEELPFKEFTEMKGE